jgi:hypothetical protein
MNKAIGLVLTSGRLACAAQAAWQKVCFYEHISRKPSWLLRLVLPTPQRTSGSYRQVGDVSRCMYSDGGYLAKTITRIVPGKRIDFDITEQTIRYNERIVLRGGTIEIEAHDDGSSSVRMLTHYELRFPLSFVARLFVDLVVTAMHKIVIRDMQQALATATARGSRSLLPPAARSTPDRTHSASPSAYARRYR